MQISQQVLTTHQFTGAELATLYEAENLICQIYDSYDENIVLTSPNTGECVAIDELPRVLGILSFLTENRMVEVNPKWGVDFFCQANYISDFNDLKWWRNCPGIYIVKKLISKKHLTFSAFYGIL